MRLFNKGHAVVTKAASTDETRYIINSVLLEETKEGLRTVATDGRMLAMVEDVMESKAKDPTEYPANVIPATAPNGAVSAVVPTQAIKDAVKSIPKSKNLPILQNVALVMGKEVTTLATTDLENPKVITARNIDAQYPNYKQVIPKDDPKDFTISFDPARMIKAAQIAKDFGLYHMKMQFTSDLNPVKITGEINGQKLTVVLMPLKP